MMVVRTPTPSEGHLPPCQPTATRRGRLGWVVFIFILIGVSLFGVTGPFSTSTEAGSCEVTADNRSDFSETTCSRRAFLRGGKKKVLGYIFYEDNQTTMAETRKYFQGVDLNAGINQDIFPGWEMWLFHDLKDSVTLSALNRLASRHANLLLCDVRANPLFGNAAKLNPRLWRFLPLCDPQVDVLASRDLDSVASEREQSAVQEWMASEHPFHVMRDHPGHDAPMLAGMWGAKIPGHRQGLRKTLLQVLKDKSAYAPRSVTSNDQALLEKYFWPWAKDASLQHDSYTCENYAKSRPWPTRRNEGEVSNFVGAPVALNASVTEECPKRCRPKDHQDWTHC